MTTRFPLRDAQVQMTLAAIAYAGQGNSPELHSAPQIRAAINRQLTAHPEYATGSDWSLIWGPEATSLSENLAYVAYNSADHTVSVCLRGTIAAVGSVFEDYPLVQVPFPFFNDTGAKVSIDFLYALARIMALKDGFSGQTIPDAINAFADGTPVSRVIVTGHSQGAALTPLMAHALKFGSLGSAAVSAPVSGFAFAPPTPGNPAFAALVGESLDCWFVINPLDLIPLGYCCIRDVIDKGIPEPEGGTTPAQWAAVAAVVKKAQAEFDKTGPWAQPAQQARLPRVPLTGDLISVAGDQHNHNSYLCLLGAPQTDVGTPSPFPDCPLQDPVIRT